MRVAGIDFSSHAIDIVTVPLDDGRADWHRFAISGADAFERARRVSEIMPGRAASFWDDILAVGIEEPTGKFKPGLGYRVQGAVLNCVPARMLVQPWPPSKWRKAAGLSGNATKDQVRDHSIDALFGQWDEWPQDAHDAHLIALATRSLVNTEAAA